MSMFSQLLVMLLNWNGFQNSTGQTLKTIFSNIYYRMAKKKRVKKAVRNKRSVRRSKEKISHKFRKTSGRSVRYTHSSRRKLGVVIANLILFIILGIVAYVLYNSSSQLIYKNLFFLLTFLLGFVSLAFFIALLVLLILKLMKK